MKIVADIHLHSYFSRATSKNLNLEHLAKWAQFKGVNIVGTGDIAHPGWLEEMQTKLEPAEDGLFRLKPEIAESVQAEVFKTCRGEVRFMLAGEISNIYKKNDKVRKIHNVVFFPSFEALEKFQAELEKIGNIRSDGRPILGLDARDLFEIVLETDPQGYLIPAHIWTPWFSLLGSMSGFDSVGECFGDLTEHIFALETGLSSDPPMNWRLSALDNYTLVSNSDAHSPAKLAREANVFDTDLSYSKLFDALKTGDPEEFLGTIEFFPEEGKYHYDGHRKCGIRWHPVTTLEHDKVCPECGRPVTVGVMHRVETLADREAGDKPKRTPPYRSLIPLPEVLAEIYQCGVNTKKVNNSFETLLSKLGSELHILQDVPLEDLTKLGGSLLAEAVRRMRIGEVKIAAGYDGEYGVVRLFEDNEREKYSVQIGFFENSKQKKETSTIQENKAAFRPATKRGENKPDTGNSAPAEVKNAKTDFSKAADESKILADLNSEQHAAVTHTNGPLIVVAGPGTGKTRTLTHRIAYLLERHQISPEHILAVTFTNKAAQEMRTRLTHLLNAETVEKLTVKTLHAFAAQLLRQHGREIGIEPQFGIADDRIRVRLLKSVRPSFRSKEITQALDLIARAKNQLIPPEDASRFGDSHGLSEFADVYRNYQSELIRYQVLDYDDLISYVVKLFADAPAILEGIQERYRWISVDEYQDINFAQYQFLRRLTAKAASVCVIGDPDQAIYGFRGASRDYFLKFKEQFPNAKKVQLTQNYRSTQQILDASAQIISKSSESYTSKIWSDFISQTKIDIYHAPTAEAEAEYVVHQIEKMVGGTSYFSLDSGRVGDDEAGSRTFGDFAVLYRLNALSGLLETAFNRSGIPHQTAGEQSLYARPEVQQLLDFLWFVYRPHSNLHLQNVLENSFNLGTDTIQKLHMMAQKRGESLWQTMQHDLILANLETSQRRAVQSGIAELKKLLKNGETWTVTELIEYVSQSFFSDTYFTETVARKSIVKQMLLKARQFDKHLQAFLETTALSSESDFHDPRADRVSLMTLHAAKGLEFKVVFIIGCEETLIPYQKNGKIDDLEEERRLFYVGMTRAQEKLTLTHTKSRLIFGKYRKNPPSRFLSHVEDSLKEIKEMQYQVRKADKLKKSQMKLF